LTVDYSRNGTLLRLLARGNTLGHRVAVVQVRSREKGEMRGKRGKRKVEKKKERKKESVEKDWECTEGMDRWTPNR